MSEISICSESLEELLGDPEALAKAHFALLADVLIQFTLALVALLLLSHLLFHVSIESL